MGSNPNGPEIWHGPMVWRNDQQSVAWFGRKLNHALSLAFPMRCPMHKFLAASCQLTRIVFPCRQDHIDVHKKIGKTWKDIKIYRLLDNQNSWIAGNSFTPGSRLCLFAFTVFLEAYLDLDDPEVRLRRFRVAVGSWPKISELWSVLLAIYCIGYSEIFMGY